MNSHHTSTKVIEFILVGPGYGEAILIDVGSNNWILIDSCWDNQNRQPAALKILKERGIGLDNVKMIIATHWHDDHVRGLSQVYRECSSARLVIPSLFNNAEFGAFLAAYAGSDLTSSHSGTKELFGSLSIANNEQRPVILGVSDKCILRIPGRNLDHGLDCAIHTLSPSDSQMIKFMRTIGTNAPIPGVTKRRCSTPSRNEAAIAVWIEVGDLHLLLGSDLEDTGDPDDGWMAVVQSNARPQKKASVIKVAHHGSQTGHNEDVWSTMCIPKPVSALTPFRRGRVKLPTAADKDRIRSLSSRSFLTSDVPIATVKIPNKAASKTIAEAGIQLRSAESPTGHVSFILESLVPEPLWKFELSAEAKEIT